MTVLGLPWGGARAAPPGAGSEWHGRALELPRASYTAAFVTWESSTTAAALAELASIGSPTWGGEAAHGREQRIILKNVCQLIQLGRRARASIIAAATAPMTPPLRAGATPSAAAAGFPCSISAIMEPMTIPLASASWLCSCSPSSTSYRAAALRRTSTVRALRPGRTSGVEDERPPATGRNSRSAALAGAPLMPPLTPGAPLTAAIAAGWIN